MFLDKDSIYMDGISMGKYLTQVKYGYHKLWSSDSGRALSGKMSGTLIGIFPKIIMTFRTLTTKELTTLAPHFDNPQQTIQYMDPNKNKQITMQTYTGDWDNTYKDMEKGKVSDLSFISVDRRQ